MPGLNRPMLAPASSATVSSTADIRTMTRPGARHLSASCGVLRTTSSDVLSRGRRRWPVTKSTTSAPASNPRPTIEDVPNGIRTSCSASAAPRSRPRKRTSVL